MIQIKHVVKEETDGPVLSLVRAFTLHLRSFGNSEDSYQCLDT